ncbi:MAG TPA: class F sortase [Actinocatenispora sp.]
MAADATDGGAMSAGHERDDRGRGLAWLVAAVGMLVVVLATGCAAAARTGSGDTRPHTSPRASLSPADRIDGRAADPIRVRIPSLDIDAPIDPVRVDRGGALQPPRTFDHAGWWQAGPEPGERGPAVILGHVDSYRGPAVFFRLATMKVGDQVFVDRADGSTAVFADRRMERRPKKAFPTEEVYGDTPDAELRLITCGGRFDPATRSYLDNVIVFARRIR